MKTYSDIFDKLISFDNSELAYRNARKRKSQSPSVREFDKHWQLNLVALWKELKTKKYIPRPLTTFILHDPKTRKICKSDFQDRVVHHALINVLQPIFEPRFIHDSYASRKGKGTLAALRRFDAFVRKVTSNDQHFCFVLKADIKHYFDTVDHTVLVNCIQKRVNDKGVLGLIKIILTHYNSGDPGKGMPLGQLDKPILRQCLPTRTGPIRQAPTQSQTLHSIRR